MPDPHDLLAARLAAEHDLLVQRAQSLDSSVGLTLGFATALAALADVGRSPAGRLALALAVCSALTSLAALGLQPIVTMTFGWGAKELPALDARELLDYDLRRHIQVERRVERKRRLFRLATWLLVAALVAGSGGIVERGGGSRV